MSAHRPWVWVVVTVLCAGLAACGADSDPPVPTAQLKAQLAQYREDEVAHRIRVRLTNPGGSQVTIVRLTLDWPGLASSPASPDYPLGPGQEAALPLSYTQAVCGPGATSTKPPASAPVVVATVRDGDRSREERIRPQADEGVLRRIWTADCRRQALEAATDVRFGPEWAPSIVNGVPSLSGAIEITREASDAPINVTGLSGSVLLNIVALSPSQSPLMSVPPEVKKGTLPVAVFTTRRCDGHSLGEAKKPYDFNVQISLGTGEPSPATIVPDAATKALMLRTIQRGCGLAPG